MIDAEEVTRFEVIDEKSRCCLVRYGTIVTIVMQDAGRTMKVFLKEREPDVYP